VKFAAAIIQIGSPMMRKTMAVPAVSSVAAHGQSVRLSRRERKRGSSPSSASCDMVREAPAKGCIVPWNMLSMMNQIAAALPKLPSNGAKVGPSTVARSSPSLSGPSTPSQTSGSAMK
jgi:hypothetical protein